MPLILNTEGSWEGAFFVGYFLEFKILNFEFTDKFIDPSLLFSKKGRIFTAQLTKRMIRGTILMLCLMAAGFTGNAQVKILFDATKAETAGNADWIIDANTHNLYWNPTAVVNAGSESNAQQLPSPAQSGITAATAETYWNGGLSNWGIDCVKQGYTVESLPYNGSITYGNSSNTQDLSNYNIFIVCEPNLLFSSNEITAILIFVQNGGSLFMISDHDQSDRNGDGYDSPAIWNDLLSHSNMGITFNINWFSETSSSIVSSGADSISTGQFGTVSQVMWSDGTDMTINTNVNPTVRGVVFRSGSTNNNSKVMFAYAHYGSGKVAAIGDSSPCDDGTGDSNDNLYNGYTQDANGNHQKLLMNATIWLAKGVSTDITSPISENNNYEIFSNSSALHFENNTSKACAFQIFDLNGKLILSSTALPGMSVHDLSSLSDGMYVVVTDEKRQLISVLGK